VNVQADIAALKQEVPHIVVGTPGRIMDLAAKRKVVQ
jgi:superfamily II DNA/RNA helicase